MRLCGRRVGFHVNTHENVAQFAVILPVAGIYSVELAISYDNIVDAVLDQAGRKPAGTDGYRNREWIIIDYGETIVHIFLPETRTRYALEELYSDAPVTEIPDED